MAKSDVGKGYRLVKPGLRLGPEWKWSEGKHPVFDKIRKDSRLLPFFEGKLRTLAHRQQQALDCTNYLLVLLLRGYAHVTLINAARERGIRDTDSLKDNLERVKNTLPVDDIEGIPDV